ncbi:response regulator [bacterium]|nr:response regulator [bacterium]
MTPAQTSILLLEDDDNLREVLAMTLEDADFEVTACRRPEDAIAAAKARRYQLFITDVRMAGSTDGVGALVAIKAVRRTIRTIIITGYASEDVPVRAMQAQADDYLLKGDQGFGIGELLRVIKRVLERAPASASWGDRLRRWVSMPSRMLVEARLPELEQERQNFFDQFFVGLRPGHINPENAYQIWRRLQDYELRFHQISQPGQVAQLRDGYRALSRHLLSASPLPEPGGKDLVSREQVGHIVRRLREGKVSAEQLRLATILLLDPEARRNSAEAFACFQGLWGRPNEAVEPSPVDPRIGLMVAGHRIAELLESRGDVERYRALSPKVGSEPRLLEIIPVTPESSAALARAKERQSLRHGERRENHFWVLRDWHTREQTLANWLRPGGYDPVDLVTNLRPLFESIYQFHGQGLHDGGLNLGRVHVTARGPVVEEFSTYLPWRLFLERGKALGGVQVFYIAPEIFHDGLSAASDQYSLGVMVYQLLTGSSSQDLTQLMQSRFNGHTPELYDAEKLAAPLQQMVHHDPTRRFANVGLAWQALLKAGS